MKKKLTSAMKEKRDKRRAEFKATIKKVAALTVEQRQELVGKIGVIPTVTGSALSPFNSCLVMYQNPDVSMVGGFRQWKSAGRSVTKGQHGLGIWIPTVNQKEENPEVNETRFFMGTVFDISQTEEIKDAKNNA